MEHNGSGAAACRTELPKLYLRLLALVAVLLMLAGCGDLLDSRRSSAALPLDFAAGLPAGWEAIDTWHEVNVDGDPATEYMLLFRFDVGQVGAVIYDGQVNGDAGATTALPGDAAVMTGTTATPDDEPLVAPGAAAVPSQGFGFYRPYRLLPNYWAFNYGGDSGHGMVAPPGYDDAITVVTVPYAANDPDENAPAELVLRGGDTYLTFAWWKNSLEGYGVTQLVATGGFRGIDWAEWQKEPVPITSIAGLEPLTDYRARSHICREIDYIRRTPGVVVLPDEDVAVEPPVVAAGADVAFAAQDRGLRFCSEVVPATPFYPEGVVLTYLQRPPQGDRTLERLVAPSTTTAQIDADGALARLSSERIDDIATYPTIPVPPGGVQSGELAPATLVCVALSERENPSIQRWLVFTLRYQPPDVETRLPDRWAIAGVRFEPQPVTPPQRPYCETVLARSAP